MKGTRLKYMEHPVVLYGCETWSLSCLGKNMG